VRDNLFFGENWPNGDTTSIFGKKYFLEKNSLAKLPRILGSVFSPIYLLATILNDHVQKCH